MNIPQNVYFKWVHFILCEYLNQTVKNTINTIIAMLILTTFLLYIQADAKNNWDESEKDLGEHGGRLQ